MQRNTNADQPQGGEHQREQVGAGERQAAMRPAATARPGRAVSCCDDERVDRHGRRRLAGERQRVLARRQLVRNRVVIRDHPVRVGRHGGDDRGGRVHGDLDLLVWLEAGCRAVQVIMTVHGGLGGQLLPAARTANCSRRRDGDADRFGTTRATLPACARGGHDDRRDCEHRQDGRGYEHGTDCANSAMHDHPDCGSTGVCGFVSGTGMPLPLSAPRPLSCPAPPPLSWPLLDDADPLDGTLVSSDAASSLPFSTAAASAALCSFRRRRIHHQTPYPPPARRMSSTSSGQGSAHMLVLCLMAANGAPVVCCSPLTGTGMILTCAVSGPAGYTPDRWAVTRTKLPGSSCSSGAGCTVASVTPNGPVTETVWVPVSRTLPMLWTV